MTSRGAPLFSVQSANPLRALELWLFTRPLSSLGPQLLQLHTARLVQGPVRPGSAIVAGVRLQYPAQMLLTKDDDVVL